MNRRRIKRNRSLAVLGMLVFSLAVLGCGGEPEVAAGSTLKASPARASIGGEPQQLVNTAKPAKPGTQAGVAGTWRAHCGDLQFTIKLTSKDQGLQGFVSSADGKVEPIKIGVLSSDAFLFETRGDGGGWMWTGELTNGSLKGYRENVQTGAVETFTARRSE